MRKQRITEMDERLNMIKKEIRGTEGGIRMMDYQQVKNRVEKEDKELKKIVIGTGIGMLVALLATVFLIR